MRNANIAEAFDRRNFLKLAAAGSLAFAFPARGIKPIERAGVPNLKLGLNIYSFLEQLKTNLTDATQGIDLLGVCQWAAQQNFDAVDLTAYFFPGYPKAPDDQFINQVKRRVHDLGLTISGTGVKNDFAIADAAVRASGVQLAKDWIEVAARLGAPVVRVCAGPRETFRDWQSAAPGAKREEVEGWMADCLHQCSEHGKKFGVLVAVQNHGDFISTGPEHLSLLQRVDHPWCGPLVDTGKYFTDDPYSDIAMMAPYAINWQIKETLGSTLKSPRTDFKKLVQVIRASRYRGFVPIETLSMGRKDYDPAKEVLNVLAELRDAIAAH